MKVPVRALAATSALFFILCFMGPAQSLSCQNFDTPQGYIRDGSDTTCALLKVNADGSVNTSTSGGSVNTVPNASATTNLSSTVTVGVTFQTLAASSTSRKSLEFQNKCQVAGNCVSTADVCYVNFGVLGSATLAKSIVLQPGASYLRASGNIPSDAFNITCTGTGDVFYAAVQ